MSAELLTALGVVVAMATGILGLYYLARQSSRESARMRQADLDRAVANATAPLTAELAQVTAERDYHRRRADDLEAELRRPR